VDGQFRGHHLARRIQARLLVAGGWHAPLEPSDRGDRRARRGLPLPIDRVDGQCRGHHRVGSDGNLYYWWQAADTTPWNMQTVATAGLYYFPSIAWTGDSVVITASGVGGNLYYWWQAAGTAPWNMQQVA
jgi:hypothetical protein